MDNINTIKRYPNERTFIFTSFADAKNVYNELLYRTEELKQLTTLGDVYRLSGTKKEVNIKFTNYIGWYDLRGKMGIDGYYDVEDCKNVHMLRLPPYQFVKDCAGTIHKGLWESMRSPEVLDIIFKPAKDLCKKNNSINHTKEDKPMLKEIMCIATNDLPKVTDVQTFNERVVKVIFDDGSFTKAVCSKDDVFDLDTGIMVCLIRRMIAKDADSATYAFNRLMSDIHRTMERNEKAKIKEKHRKAAEETERQQIQRKRQLKNDKKDCEKLNLLSDVVRIGVLNALKTDREINKESGDDE